MDEELMREIVDELKGLRREAISTNNRLDGLQMEAKATNQRLDGLQIEAKATNQRLDGLQTEAKITNQRLSTTIDRLDDTVNHLDGLHESVVVLQQGVSDLRYDVHNIKDILAQRVIWQNDSISILTKEGKVIYGVIQKSDQK